MTNIVFWMKRITLCCFVDLHLQERDILQGGVMKNAALIEDMWMKLKHITELFFFFFIFAIQNNFEKQDHAKYIYCRTLFLIFW